MEPESSVEKNRAPKRSQFGKQFLIWFGVAFIAFLLGFVPMWWSKRTVNNELVTTKRELKRQQMQNSLSASAVYAKRGEYETARQNASTFFTDIQGAVNSTDTDVLTAQERTQISALLSGRDEVITLLSRGDPASADKIADMYVAYRSVTSVGPPQ